MHITYYHNCRFVRNSVTKLALNGINFLKIIFGRQEDEKMRASLLAPFTDIYSILAMPSIILIQQIGWRQVLPDENVCCSSELDMFHLGSPQLGLIIFLPAGALKRSNQKSAADLKGMDEKLESKGKVCVTGASGYLASCLIKRLLLSGYHVIGTVRDLGNQKKLAHLWKLEGAKERLRLVEADLMKECSFDDAILGCHGVFHSASPVLKKPSSDPKREVLEPAIEGTLNVLRSCKKNPSLRRVVLTSSSTALRNRPDEDLASCVKLDESSWSSVEHCQRLQLWYPLSKVLAEKAAGDFCKENGIDLVTVLPAWVIGPSLSPDLCLTASRVLSLLKGDTVWYGRMGYVHIDDVALCHILVYEHESAHGRYLCSSTVLDNDELASLLSMRYPSLPIATRLKQVSRPYYEFDTSKLQSLGFKFKSIQEMFDDCIDSLVEQGHLSAL